MLTQILVISVNITVSVAADPLRETQHSSVSRVALGALVFVFKHSRLLQAGGVVFVIASSPNR